MMILNSLGEIVQTCWRNLPSHYSRVTLDEFVVMPDHVHGIVAIDREQNSTVGNRHACSLQQNSRRQNQTIPIVIGSFKSAVTRQIHIIGELNFQWQKSYYDHIIQNDKSLHAIRDYIRKNPLNWQDYLEKPL